MNINYLEIGLKVGLEIHQQLDTQTKLFCSCKPELFKEKPQTTFLRRLRPTQSELGQIDPAAYFEFQKGIKILYEANQETSCLVEMDEEPPHDLNREALETALTIALMINTQSVNEVHVMRKTVIDGSNTTGFQRTCTIALDGIIEVKGKRVPIQLVALEEDAARKMGEEDSTIIYRIDRLGIPLIEVTTAPVIFSPKEGEEVALAIGRMLRATGKVKRGLGTIRQDLNISIRNGALMEIKGVQELELVSVVIENEVKRQLSLLEIRDELQKRSVKEEHIQEEFVDVTPVFEKTKSKVIGEAINKGGRVLAAKLCGFNELLKRELAADMRLGREFADRARFWGRVGGIFHTDELPAYGITSQEVEKLRHVVKAEPQDAVVLVAASLENATDALRAVVERARETLKGVPEETRAADPDGTTHYMRPRPGAARMYPETDVPPIQISEEYLNGLRACLPELPEQKMERLIKDHGLNEKLARQVLDSEYLGLFGVIVKESKVSATTVAVVLTETLKALKRDGVAVEKIGDEQFRELFRLVGDNAIAKEAIGDILVWLSKHENASVEEAVESLGVGMISEVDLEKLIDGLIEKNKGLIEKKGDGAFGVLIGLIMKEYRGRVKAEVASELLKKKLKKFSG